MKKLINIRGAVASGKTTAVKQFCERRGFHVENISLNDAIVPVSIIGAGDIVAIGNYAKTSNCIGVDNLKGKNGVSAGKDFLKKAIVAIARKYNPDIIVYEHMLTSQIFKSTKEIADVAKTIGYDYFGYQLYRSEKSRLELLKGRSGSSAGMKTFSRNAVRVNRATVMLNEAGYSVKVINVEKIAQEDMWTVVENAIKAAL